MRRVSSFSGVARGPPWKLPADHRLKTPDLSCIGLCHWLNNGDIVGMNWDVRKCLLEVAGLLSLARLAWCSLELIPSNRPFGSALFPEICPRTTWFNAFSAVI